MQITLDKYDGLGNDFLVYDLAQGEPTRAWPELAQLVCDRESGQGADGLLVLERRSGTELTMVLYNSDGSRAEMSGNGIRCLVMAAHRAVAGSIGAEYVVHTDAGLRHVSVVSQLPNGDLELSVDMGSVTALPVPDNWETLQCHPDRPVQHVSIGNPHSVVGVDDVTTVDLRALGEKVPQVNLEIIQPGPETNAIRMRVHERGAGITRACGTGACAAADAAVQWGLVPRSAPEVIVHMDGGSARVRVDAQRNVTLVGPTTYVDTFTVTV